MKKLMYKVPEVGWRHLCYLPEDTMVHSENGINKLVDKWAMEDFGFTIKTVEDLAELRQMVVGYFRKKYPELYLQDNSYYDAGGLTRSWVLQHLEEENDETA